MVFNHIAQLALAKVKFIHSKIIVSLSEAKSFENLSQAIVLPHCTYPSLRWCILSSMLAIRSKNIPKITGGILVKLKYLLTSRWYNQEVSEEWWELFLHLHSFRISHFGGFYFFCRDNILKHKLIIYHPDILLVRPVCLGHFWRKATGSEFRGTMNHIYIYISIQRHMISYVNISNHAEPSLSNFNIYFGFFFLFNFFTYLN